MGHHGRHWLPLFVNFVFFQPIYLEQQKISQLFETFENLVNKLEETILLLKNLKNDFTNKMFANFSSDFPSIRFKGFKSAWITDQVKNLFELSRGQSLTKNQIKTRPVEERERERETADTSTRYIHHKQRIMEYLAITTNIWSKKDNFFNSRKSWIG
ncbi:hypothetical protein [Mesomycoplasma ovipneumoniae]|uniref:hypothetical protein n=1 Tax=Mesomycoplasma ovipneumoniae TaxID=29562 RepID=UPI00311CB8CC